MATKKDKDNNGPSTQRTATVGVNAVGVNHGMTRQEAVKSTPQQAMAQLSQPVVQQVAQPIAQVQPQTDTNAQQNPVVRPTQTAPTTNGVQPIQQQFALPQQITMPNGQVINIQPQGQPIQQQGQMPQQVTIGNNTYQMPTQTNVNTPVQQPNEPSTAQQNAEYEATKQYNQLVDEYRNAGGNPNAIRQHNDPAIERIQPTAEQVQQAQANAQKQAKTDDDKYIKTVMERIDELRETPEKRAQREKREARQRKWAAISEGIANVFNVGGAIAGAKPATWKSGVGELYANQEAENDKRRLEYRQALKDMMDYKTAIRNGDIATARLIEERRKNDYLEQKALADIATKEQANRIAQENHENNEKRAQVKSDDQHRAANTKEELDRQKLANGGTAPGRSSKKSKSKKSSKTGAAAAKSAKAAAKRRAKAATQGTKFGKK